MSISSLAFSIPLYAASATYSLSAMNVITVRLVSDPMSTSKISTVSTDSIAEHICSIIFLSLPSEKLGTHSTIFVKDISIALQSFNNKFFVHCCQKES